MSHRSPRCWRARPAAAVRAWRRAALIAVSSSSSTSSRSRWRSMAPWLVVQGLAPAQQQHGHSLGHHRRSCPHHPDCMNLQLLPAPLIFSGRSAAPRGLTLAACARSVLLLAPRCRLHHLSHSPLILPTSLLQLAADAHGARSVRCGALVVACARCRCLPARPAAMPSCAPRPRPHARGWRRPACCSTTTPADEAAAWPLRRTGIGHSTTGRAGPFRHHTQHLSSRGCSPRGHPSSNSSPRDRRDPPPTSLLINGTQPDQDTGAGNMALSCTNSMHRHRPHARRAQVTRLLHGPRTSAASILASARPQRRGGAARRSHFNRSRPAARPARWTRPPTPRPSALVLAAPAPRLCWPRRRRAQVSRRRARQSARRGGGDTRVPPRNLRPPRPGQPAALIAPSNPSARLARPVSRARGSASSRRSGPPGPWPGDQPLAPDLALGARRPPVVRLALALPGTRSGDPGPAAEAATPPGPRQAAATAPRPRKPTRTQARPRRLRAEWPARRPSPRSKSPAAERDRARDPAARRPGRDPATPANRAVAARHRAVDRQQVHDSKSFDLTPLGLCAAAARSADWPPRAVRAGARAPRRAARKAFASLAGPGQTATVLHRPMTSAADHGDRPGRAKTSGPRPRSDHRGQRLRGNAVTGREAIPALVPAGVCCWRSAASPPPPDSPDQPRRRADSAAPAMAPRRVGADPRRPRLPARPQVPSQPVLITVAQGGQVAGSRFRAGPGSAPLPLAGAPLDESSTQWPTQPACCRC